MLTLFVGCENLDETALPESKTVSFSNGGIQFSKVTNNQFDNGDKINVKAFCAGVEYAQTDYTYQSSMFTSTSPFSIADGVELSYDAIYPSTASYSGVFEVQKDQTSASGYEQSDLLVAKVDASSSTTPELVFNHVLSSLILNVEVKENGVAKTGSNVDVSFYMKNQANVDVDSESYSGTGNATNIYPYPSVGNGQSNVFNYSVIVAPQTVAANSTIAYVSVDSVQYYFTYGTDIVLQSSKQHTYTFTVDIVTNETEIKFGGVINGWDDATQDGSSSTDGSSSSGSSTDSDSDSDDTVSDADTTTTTVTMAYNLADFSATSYPTENAWLLISSDSMPETSAFEGLNAALTSLQNSGREISLDFGDITYIPASALTNQTAIAGITANKVTYIGASAFANCTSLSAVELPMAVSMGDSAFSCCSKMYSFKAPVMWSLPTLALQGCSSLMMVELPSVTTLNNFAFSEVNNMLALKLATDSVKLTAINGAFFDCNTEGTTLIIGVESSEYVSENTLTIGSKSQTFKAISLSY